MASLWQKFVAPLLRSESYARGAALQERADLLHLFLLAHARREWPSCDLSVLESVEASPPTVGAQRQLVKDHVQQQTLSQLEAWRNERPRPLPPQSREAPVDEARRASAEAAWQAERTEAQHRAFGCAVSVRPSGAGAGAGQGVFLAGGAPPGSVVALYAGISYEPADLISLPGGIATFEGNEYLMARHDRTIVDGSARARALLSAEAVDCPLAVGHLINHPPAGTAPNVVPAALDVDVVVPPELAALLPNLAYRQAEPQLLLEGGAAPPSGLLEMLRKSIRDAGSEEGGVHVLRGLALISSREVRDEELFLNYRLNPANAYPPWYAPVDVEEDARRWER